MAQPDGARSEATRGSISRYRKIHDTGQLGEWVIGDTERLKTWGNPVNWSVGTAEGCEDRGDSKLHRR